MYRTLGARNPCSFTRTHKFPATFVRGNATAAAKPAPAQKQSESKLYKSFVNMWSCKVRDIPFSTGRGQTSHASVFY